MLRFAHHIKEIQSSNHSHPCQEFEKDWFTYNKNAFQFEILETGFHLNNKKERQILEKKHISSIKKETSFQLYNSSYEINSSSYSVAFTYKGQKYSGLENIKTIINQDREQKNQKPYTSNTIMSLIRNLNEDYQLEREPRTLAIIVDDKHYDNYQKVLDAGLAKDKDQVMYRIKTKNPKWKNWYFVKKGRPTIIPRFKIGDKTFIGAQEVVDAGLAKNKDQVKYRVKMDTYPDWTRSNA